MLTVWCWRSGEEVRLDVPKANYLNDNGIITCVNFYNGFVSWGNYTSAFPANTDPVDYFYNINRMFKYIAKTVILTSWNDVDRRITRRLLDAIMQGVNYWLNSLTAEEKILGGRVEMLESENALTNLMAGRVKFHIYVTPPVPVAAAELGNGIRSFLPASAAVPGGVRRRGKKCRKLISW